MQEVKHMQSIKASSDLHTNKALSKQEASVETTHF